MCRRTPNLGEYRCSAVMNIGDTLMAITSRMGAMLPTGIH